MARIAASTWRNDVKITIDRSLLEQALDALERERPYLGPMPSKTSAAIDALREALAQPQQELVAWMHAWNDGEKIPLLHNDPSKLDPPESVRPHVYGDTSQPARNPLTDEQKAYFVNEIVQLGTQFVTPLFAVVEAIEAAAHGIKDES